MANLIQTAKDQVAELTQRAYEKAAAQGLLPQGETIRGTVEVPKDSRNGDFASSFAMAGAKALKMAPRAIAQIILDNMDLEGTLFQRAEIAGPGFLNFFYSPNWYQQVLAAVEADPAGYGSSDVGHGQKVMVEFVSANPTGPMHMGNARGGVLGDTLANVLSRVGYNTWKEFYVNDAGNQVHKFAQSIHARYMQILLGEDGFEFPENGYQGEDIKELAQAFYEVHGDSYKDAPEEKWLEDMSAFGLERNIPKMEADLKKYGIEYDQWFLESELHNSGYVAETVDMLAQKGWTYEKDGALWLDTTALLKAKYMREGKTQEQVDKLDLKDDVLRRANGFYTYFAADIAYHRNKFEKRGFDKVINVWGADHHGHVARLQAALDGLDLDGSNRLVIVLMQLVNLLQDGKPVRMSKRTGKAIALHDLLDEISVDAARYYFNNRASTSPLDFDLDLAVRQDSDNPVYYVQYAHARICSLIANLAAEGVQVPACDQVDPTVFASEEERDLIKNLAQFPNEIALAAQHYDPSRINRYLTALAGDFHRFYNACRIKGEQPQVQLARLKLAHSVRLVLANGLGLLGVTAPEKM
ncbi:arginine--tRNA ligase [Pseudoflavonifractor sp. An85]|uniref:arginine--tRNA ligase n=1 Tax=Pseudoflavonifractor sp. An85 TaxID=1965661 RepID=UPI000B3728FC|nr:arginine--tRNA ligase [Pseudoflavonifractor sp. An85]OUN25634.1 arginine--tRNA ligase [Pseudoflavonifractor sp. An85]